MSARECYEIIGVATRFNELNRCSQLDGFRLKGVCGRVDPFVDANLSLDIFDDLLDSKGDIKINMVREYIARELKWAHNQIGKSLIVDGLSYSAFATVGAVEIK